MRIGEIVNPEGRRIGVFGGIALRPAFRDNEGRHREAAMKKFHGSFLAGILTGAAAFSLILGLPACQTKSSKTSFDRVEAALDEGGDLYFYYNVERVKALIAEVMDIAKEALPADKSKAEDFMGMAPKIITSLGLDAIDGIGASSMTVESDLFRTRFVLHHPPDKGAGLIWEAMGGENRDFWLLDRLPADTVLANMADLRLSRVWDWVKNTVLAVSPDQSGFQKGLADLEAKGINLDKLIPSFDGPFGYVLTLDREKKIPIPTGKTALEIPAPGLALIMTVKDAAIFDLLKNMVPGVSYSEMEGVKRLTFGALPVPVPFAPTLIQKGDLMVAATSEVLADRLAGITTGNGLTETDAFRRMSRGAPGKGVGFTYLGPGLMQAVMEVVEKTKDPEKDPSDPDPVKLIRKFFPVDLQLYGVTETGPEGFRSVINHSVPPEKLFLLQLLPMALGQKNLFKMKDKMSEAADPAATGAVPPPKKNPIKPPAAK
jgi:hypothetical protein